MRSYLFFEFCQNITSKREFDRKVCYELEDKNFFNSVLFRYSFHRFKHKYCQNDQNSFNLFSLILLMTNEWIGKKNRDEE